MEPAKWKQDQHTQVVQVSACVITIVIMAFEKKVSEISSLDYLYS